MFHTNGPLMDPYGQPRETFTLASPKVLTMRAFRSKKKLRQIPISLHPRSNSRRNAAFHSTWSNAPLKSIKIPSTYRAGMASTLLKTCLQASSTQRPG
ncbi:hypothetical protein AWZ03_015433, partial [Drosophila navojoa]